MQFKERLGHQKIYFTINRANYKANNRKKVCVLVIVGSVVFMSALY